MKPTTGVLCAVLLSAAGLLTAAPAVAQSAVECSENGTDEERIACLQSRVDALEAELARARGELAAATPEGEVAAEPAPSPADSFGAEQLDSPTAAVAAPAATTTAAAEPAAREGRRWLRMPSIPFFGRGDDEERDAAPAAESEPVQVAAQQSEPAAPPAVDPESFGAEQVAVNTNTADEAREQEEDNILYATIIDFQELHRGRLVVALDNGQMWRQMDVDSRQVNLREGETYTVEISRSGFGGYRMKIADNHRIMQVERLR